MHRRFVLPLAAALALVSTGASAQIAGACTDRCASVAIGIESSDPNIDPEGLRRALENLLDTPVAQAGEVGATVVITGVVSQGGDALVYVRRGLENHAAFRVARRGQAEGGGWLVRWMAEAARQGMEGRLDQWDGSLASHSASRALLVDWRGRPLAAEQRAVLLQWSAEGASRLPAPPR
ncbi:MAG: hypothetical protein AAF411_16325 [Myxococcota bacterium]